MTDRTFERVAIVNRGEPAMRFIVAARELCAEAGPPLTTIALHTDPDRRAMFVREADERWSLGPATFVDDEGRRKSSYLDYARLEEALVRTRAEAAWVGWGFVAEHPEFADLCDRLGVVFIGPSAEMMRRLGDKIASKHLAEQAEVPVAPWSGGPVETLAEARAHATRLGYPLMVKATAGGGGRGIRRVTSELELESALHSARSEAVKAFGNPTVFLEKMVTRARHVEVQVIADGHGTTWALGVRDCTIQRRNQKIVEETPSPALTETQHRELEDAAVRLTQAIGYRNAGTVEFLYDDRTRSFSFMEVNARLQVEHPVTELVTGVDLVKLQVHVARGGKLDAEKPAARGHAIEVRLNAEDPDQGFAPAPGRVERLRLACGPGIRVDTGVERGDQIPAEFDSMIGKLIAHGRDRAEALARLRRALYETAVVIRGGASNKGFLLGLLDRPELRSGDVDVGWIDRLVAEGGHRSLRHAEIALVQAAIDAYETEAAIERLQFFQAAARGRPRIGDESVRTAELSYEGADYELHVGRLGPDRYRVDPPGASVEVGIEHYDHGHAVEIAGIRYRVHSVEQGLMQVVEVEGVPHRISRERGGVVRAPSPAIVVSVLVAAGDRVEVGDRLLVLEAMKMEMAVEAKFAGRVREVRVTNNVQVEAGAPLVVIESVESDEPGPRAREVTFEVLADTGRRPWTRRRLLSELRSLVLGFDADMPGLTRALAAAERPSSADDAFWAEEDEILRIFIDLRSLVRRGVGGGGEGYESGRTTEEYLFTYLRDPGAPHEELPSSFLDRLRRCVRHYGVNTLDRRLELEESLFRIYKSSQRVDDQLRPILTLLERRLDGATAGVVEPTEELRRLLRDLLAVVHDRFVAISDAARELLFRLYYQPAQEQARRRAYAEAEATLEQLTEGVDDDTRQDRFARLVGCPYPLNGVLSRQLEDASPTRRGVMLEVLARRYYRICQLQGPTTTTRGDHAVFSADYEFRGDQIRIYACHVVADRLPEAVDVSRRICAEAPADVDVVVDFYVWRPDGLRDPETESEQLSALLNAVAYPRPMRRIVFAISGFWEEYGADQVQHFTFRPDENDAELREQGVYRGLHPMMSRRLQLWRLKNFELERLPSAEDVYLFRAVARQNARDERLIALGEVRDTTPVRDEAGHLLGVPNLERMLSQALAGIRRAQSQRAEHERLHWNRVHLFVWPTLDLSTEEVNALIRKLAPQTDGLGIERVLVYVRAADPASGAIEQRVLDVSNPGGGGLVIRYRPLPDRPIQPLEEYEQKVVRLRQRGLLYPYEIIAMLTPSGREAKAAFVPGDFVEHELTEDGTLTPTDRPPGQNQANVVVGIIRNYTEKYPRVGMTRVAILSDPSRGMGALAEPECRRIIAALDLAERMRVPVEWYAVSGGAKISMDSGTENMDWIAAVLRRIVEVTQAGHEINVIVCGVNVGAQPYWNAEATMLMHTRGILVMVPDGTMVLTGKRALDYSGGVSAEDNAGIGGFERIMGPNGQAQYGANDIAHACRILLRHYEHTYVVPGERSPRRAATSDPFDRDVCDFVHGRIGGTDFATVGDVLSDEHNPGRKKPFEIRRVMRSVIDRDHEPLERWLGMRDAETAVVWDAHVGGFPTCLLGIESRPVQRLGYIPADGPTQWTSGTLFPLSSKKVARAINAASGNRPVVVLANLSGFDGSPESMRKLQLEYGAEIGRAVVNFRGPMVFCVISRYHGGAFVVFSNRLNDNLEVVALEGTFASVIGGAPAAAVVFAGEVQKRTQNDRRVVELASALDNASGAERVALASKLEAVTRAVHAERLREVATEFDTIHSVQRAKRVGSVQHVVPPSRLRPFLIEAIERGHAKLLRSTEH